MRRSPKELLEDKEFDVKIKVAEEKIHTKELFSKPKKRKETYKRIDSEFISN